MSRLLVITHTFPPSRHSNAKRPFYLVKGFLEAGWEVEVFTSRLAMEANAAEILEGPKLKIQRWPDPIERWLRRLAGHRLFYRLFVFGAGSIMWPDLHVRWVRRVIQGVRGGPGYDQVLAFVLPASVLLTGRSPGLVGANWIFDYQESVTPQFRRRPRRSPWQRLLLPRLRRLEAATLHRAGRVVFTAQTNRRAYIEEGLVPEAATAHVPYFYDADVFRPPVPAVSPDFEIVYFGTFDWYGARTPATFLKALARFLSRQPAARGRARFVFYGQWLTGHNRLISELGLETAVAIHAPVSYAEYVQKVRQSPVLLLVVSAMHDLFMPSKLVEYFGARRPVLAFVPRRSEMRQVLETAGLGEFTCDEFDVDAGTLALERLWKGYQSGQFTCTGEQTGYWSSEVQVPRYLELVARTARP